MSKPSLRWFHPFRFLPPGFLPILFLLSLPLTGTGQEIFTSGTENIVSTTPVSIPNPAQTSVDPELTTYELTLLAVEMQTNRARILLSNLTSETQRQGGMEFDLTAEKASLDEILKAHDTGDDPERLRSKVESLKLDGKLLESKRNILQSRVKEVEIQIPEVQKSLEQTRNDQEENRRLLEQLEKRERELKEKSATLAEADEGLKKKIAAMGDLVAARSAREGVLSQLQAALGKNEAILKGQQERGKSGLELYNRYLHDLDKLVGTHEETLARLNFKALENEANHGIEQAKKELDSLQPKLEQSENALFRVQNASSTTQERALLVAQRDALLAQKECFHEAIRHYELLLRKGNELGYLDEIKRKGLTNTRSSRSALGASGQEWLKKVEENLSGLERDRGLILKRGELIRANRRLHEHSIREAETRKGRQTAATPPGKEEIQLRKQALQSLEQTAGYIERQEKTLSEIIQESKEVRIRIRENFQRILEHNLLSRAIFRPRSGYRTLILESIKGIPGTFWKRFREGLAELDLSSILLLFLLLGGGLGLGIALKRLPALPPGGREALSPGLSAFERFRTAGVAWAGGEAVPVAALTMALAADWIVPQLHFFLLVILLLGLSRICFSFVRSVILPELSNLPGVSGALGTANLLFAWFMPFLILLDKIGESPEIMFILGLAFRISLVFPVFRLAFLMDEVNNQLIGILGLGQRPTSRKFAGYAFRFAVWGTLVFLFIAILGFRNLAYAFFAKEFELLGILLLVALGRPIGDALATYLYDPATGPKLLVRDPSRSQFLLFVTRKTFRLLVWLLAAGLAFRMIGMTSETPVIRSVVSWFLGNSDWIYGRFIHILIIIIAVGIAIEFIRTLGESVISYVHTEDRASLSENERRASTLVQILNTTARVIILAIAGIMILRELGMDITPLLTGAGIVGVAIGFGSQSLVKDFFAGFFILVENQFRVGDVIEVDGKSGLVEKITLKTTVLRGIDGSVNIVPNGSITSVRNMTYAWSRAVIDIGISYDADIDQALATLAEIGKELCERPDLKSEIMGFPEILGVEQLAESEVTLRMLVKTKPLAQWNIARIFRKRIKEEFERRGIEIPFNQLVVTLRGDEILKRTLEALKK